MYFSDIDKDLKKGDLIKIHRGVSIGNFMLNENMFAIYLLEYKNYYVKVLYEGKVEILSKVLISGVCFVIISYDIHCFFYG